MPENSTASRAHSKTEVSKKVDEKSVRDALARHARGEIEWGTPAGSIDVFTQDEIIEIKHCRNWKNGVGQVLAYGEYYPVHKKRLHLFAREGERASKYFEMATKLCVKEEIRVTFEQVVTANDVGVNVVDGTDVFAISEAPEPRVAPCATTTPLPTTMAELMQWHKLQLENPSETAESCLRRLRTKAVSAENSGATSAAPSLPPCNDDGRKTGVGHKSVAESSAKVGEKRAKNQMGTDVRIKRVKVEVEDHATDEEAKQLVCKMHASVLQLVDSKLPGVVNGVYSRRNEWAKYKKKHGGDFTKRLLLSLLVHSNGAQPRLLYDNKVKTLVIEDHSRFYKVFPTFEVLRGRMNKLKLEWPAWWE